MTAKRFKATVIGGAALCVLLAASGTGAFAVDAGDQPRIYKISWYVNHHGFLGYRGWTLWASTVRTDHLWFKTLYNGKSVKVNGAVSDSTDPNRPGREKIWQPRQDDGRRRLYRLLRRQIRHRGFARLKLRAWSDSGEDRKDTRISKQAVYRCPADRERCVIDWVIR